MKYLIPILTLLLLTSCTTPKKTVPDEVIVVSGYINPRHIVLPAGESVLLKDGNKFLQFTPEQDVNYTLSSEYSKLEQRYLILLEDYAVSLKKPE